MNLESKRKKRREELTLKQKTYLGIALFVVLIVLIVTVGIPYWTHRQAQGIADQINKEYPKDHFIVLGAERHGLTFVASFQSTVHKDLVISSDLPPGDYNPQAIEYLYERALKEKPGTLRRFAMSTDDALYDALAPKMGEKLLRVMGRFGEGAGQMVALDEPFRLGKVKPFYTTIDILDEGSSENVLKYAQIVSECLKQKDYGLSGLTLAFTRDRKEAKQYVFLKEELLKGDLFSFLQKNADALKKGEEIPGLYQTMEQYFEFTYNHNYTLPKKK
ncbi:hypothetical protein ABB02_01191 [Clostridiaceae bacterium JG1575]|nr:hypothetical protein ABB02_01191 [Clostridiaceae bacterium JG1575]